MRVLLFCSASFLLIALIAILGIVLVKEIVIAGRIFDGITIDGKPVGGLTGPEAEKLVRTEVESPLKQEITLSCADDEVKFDPDSVGFSVDVEKMLENAFLAGAKQNPLARAFRVFFSEPLKNNVPVSFKYDKAKLGEYVKRLAGELDYPPVDAIIDMSEGYPQIRPSSNGLSVMQPETENAIVQSLAKHKRDIPIVTSSPEPEVTERDIGKIVVIKQSEHTLYLYDREELVNSFIIAVGMPQYPTPNGKFHITFKERNPTWLPTSEWAKDKRGVPQPPGPDNPLGKYWMDLGQGIGIHGTPFEKTLGESVSHGCIRMSNWAAGELFEAVKVGTPVYILP